MASSLRGFDDERELYIEPIYGVRTFVPVGNRLKAIAHDYLWVPGINQRYCFTTVTRRVMVPVEQDPDLVIRAADGTARDRKWAIPQDRTWTWGEDPHPMNECSCSYYAWHSHRHFEYPFDMRTVLAIIAGSGETIVGTRGFRAEQARIVALAPPLDAKRKLEVDMTALGEFYGVPVFPSLVALRTEFPPTYIDHYRDEEWPGLKGPS